MNGWMNVSRNYQVNSWLYIREVLTETNFLLSQQVDTSEAAVSAKYIWTFLSYSLVWATFCFYLGLVSGRLRGLLVTASQQLTHQSECEEASCLRVSSVLLTLLFPMFRPHSHYSWPTASRPISTRGWEPRPPRRSVAAKAHDRHRGNS